MWMLRSSRAGWCVLCSIYQLLCRAVPKRHFLSASDSLEGREERQENHSVDLCEMVDSVFCMSIWEDREGPGRLFSFVLF